MHKQIWTLDRSFIAGCLELLHKIAVLVHTGQFDNSTELDLTPATSHLRLTQAAYQFCSLLL